MGSTYGQHFQKFKAKSYDPLTLGRAFATCLIIVASNAIVLLSAKHFELAPNFHFVPLVLLKIELPTTLNHLP